MTEQINQLGIEFAYELANVKIEHLPLGQGVTYPLPKFHWRLRLERNGKVEVFDYYTHLMARQKGLTVWPQHPTFRWRKGCTPKPSDLLGEQIKSILFVDNKRAYDLCQVTTSPTKFSFEIADGSVTYRAYYTSVPPTLEQALYSLVMESELAGYTFQEWCAELGESTDSIKARETWASSQEVAAKLKRLLSESELAPLQELFQDY